MLKQAIEIFNREYSIKGDNMILDEYIPADGTYVIVDLEDNDFSISKIIDIKYDKKNKDIDRASIDVDDLDFICFADYYSNLVSMQKPVDKCKKIHSNNYLSFFVKKENIINGELTNEIIDNYYNTLKNFSHKYKGKKKSLEIYRELESKIGSVNQEQVDKISSWIKNNIFSRFKEISGKDYLKIFFKFSENDYKREGKRYLIPNMYNNNDTNEVIDEEIYGLPNNNMGLNSKKPYLENKTRKVITPYLISQDEVLIQKKFFDYLLNQAIQRKYNIYINDKFTALEDGFTLDKNFTGIFIRVSIHRDKTITEAKIDDYDVISHYTPDLISEFEYKNVLDVDYEKLKGDYKIYKTYKGMQQLLNEVLFNKLLISNYFTEPKDISIQDETLLYNLRLCRKELFNLFYKGINNNIWDLLDKVSLSVVINTIMNGYIYKAMDQINFRFSLKDYFEGGNMSIEISNVKEILRQKISCKESGSFDSDNEYLFAVGQLVGFYLSRSKSKNLMLSAINPFVDIQTDKVLKIKLKSLFKKYNYDLKNNYYKFKNLYYMVLTYQLKENINSDMLIAGFVCNNLLYEKNENEKNSNEENKEDN